MESHNGIKVGDTVVVVKNDPRDDLYRISIDNRWIIGEEFVVGRITQFLGSIYFHDMANMDSNIDSSRVNGL